MPQRVLTVKAASHRARMRRMAVLSNSYVLVLLGGALGSVFRYHAAVLFGGRPLTTFAVNVTGSFLIGLLAAAVEDPRARLLLGTGVLGGFTTFSAWQFEALLAARFEEELQAVLLILFGGLAAGFVACSLGYDLGLRFKS
jgi:fluoride exporter